MKNKEPIKIIRIIKAKGLHSWIEASVKDLVTGDWKVRILRKENKNLSI